ncbi:ASPIC/UnbV domain protein [Candidatus Sulfopaludibacter sp. SbA3]|nr:ASPIC/UnbV domain protein [Candidatus Sulfopaludibacter sp. SbA3]
MTRRSLLAIFAALSRTARGQGMSRRSVAPTPRSKPSGRPFHATFTDVAAAAGLHAPVIYGAPQHKQYLTETVGCGVAFLDYDNDGWLDIFVLGGSLLEGAPSGGGNRLYKNNRDGTFTDVTAKSGLGHTGWACAVAAGDFDNDGFDDLFVTYWGGCTLYHNNGDGTFTDATTKAGIALSPTQWGSGCTFVDYNRDGLLDLIVAHYTDFDLKSVPKLGEAASCNWKGVPVPCGPRGLSPGGVRLYRNNGNGTFTDVTTASGVSAATGSYPMTAVAADFDNDGWPDIYIACDSTASFLLKNNHDGTFREIGLEAGVALNEDGMEQAGMGLAIGDYNLDGNLDIFKTHFADDTPVLYRNNGKCDFEDVTVPSGLGVETRYTTWGAAMIDLDNDGEPDLFCVTGSIYPELNLPAYPFRTPRVVFRNLGGGKFEELLDQAGPGVSAAHSSRGCAFGDFDNDGDIDVVVINLNEPPSLLRNDVTGGGHWLKVKLVGTKSNRSAIGATVIARYGGKQQAQAVLSQSSFYSVNDFRLHFGLGTERAGDLEIRWPNGAIERIAAVACDRIVTIREGSGIVG